MRLDDETCAFLASGVSIMLASRNAQRTPSVVRAKGCVIRRDGEPGIRIFVSAAQAGELLDDVRESGMISATFSVPTTHRTLQFKGSDAAITPLESEDRNRMDSYADALAQALRPLGFSAEFTRALLASPPDEVAIEFTPSEIFRQTPGSGAGARIA